MVFILPKLYQIIAKGEKLMIDDIKQKELEQKLQEALQKGGLSAVADALKDAPLVELSEQELYDVKKSLEVIGRGVLRTYKIYYNAIFLGITYIFCQLFQV